MEENKQNELQNNKKTITIEVDDDVDIEKLIKLAKKDPDVFKTNYSDNTVEKVKQYILNEQERIKTLDIEGLKKMLLEKQKTNNKSIVLALVGLILCLAILVFCLIFIINNGAYSAFYGVGLALLIILFSILSLVSDLKEKKKIKDAILNPDKNREYLMPILPPYLDNGKNGEEVVGNPNQGIIFKNKIKK